ncbi:sulfotransferase [Blastococcus sp. SYSU DS1024]
MTTPIDSPLLVTGLPRSGTSWVGKMLEASGEVVYVNEPMNPQHPPGHSPGVLDARVTRQFQYISAEDDAEWRRAFARTLGLRYQFRAEVRQNRAAYDLARMAKYGTTFTLGRLRARRAMLDDPFAVFSTGWLAQEMGCRSVVLVRDPVSFVGSWKSLGWTMHFHELLEQPALVRDHLGPYVERMQRAVGSDDWLARVCLLWEATYDVVDRAFRPLPGVHVVSYESLVQRPLDGFADLYGRFGLTWSPAAEARVREATTERPGAEQGSHRWSLKGGLSRTAYRPMGSATALSTFRSRLTPDEVERVRELTADVAERVLPRTAPGA